MEIKRSTADAPGYSFYNRSDFERIREGLRRRYQPQNVVEEFLVKSAANSQWKLQIAEMLEGEAYTQGMSAFDRANVLGQMAQVRNRLQQCYLTAYKELERIRKRRPQPPAQPAESDDAPPGRPN
jgi:hypothetical protein